MTTTTHQFADASSAQLPNLRTNDVTLLIRQQPQFARVAVGKEKDRKPVDPPAVIQLKISSDQDPAQNYLQSPYYFMSCSLVGTTEGTAPATLGASLAGTCVSSLHRLKDSSNQDGAYFVFGDLSIKLEGKFALQFNLYELRKMECRYIKSVQCEPFIVHPSRTWPGMQESTYLTKVLFDQGVKLRIRKEPKTLLKKRGPASENYEPRHYRLHTQAQVRPGHGIETVRNESSPPNQGDFQGSVQASPYDPRPPVGRGYSHQSVESFSPSYSDERSSKRPRTGSEHSTVQSFGHPENAIPDSPGFSRMYDPQQQQQQQHQPPYSPYGQMTPQQNYGYPFAQSPQSAHAPPREQFFQPQRQLGWPQPYGTF